MLLSSLEHLTLSSYLRFEKEVQISRSWIRKDFDEGNCEVTYIDCDENSVRYTLSQVPSIVNRCQCGYRKAWMAMCSHEISAYSDFVVDFFDIQHVDRVQATKIVIISGYDINEMGNIKNHDNQVHGNSSIFSTQDDDGDDNHDQIIQSVTTSSSFFTQSNTTGSSSKRFREYTEVFHDIAKYAPRNKCSRFHDALYGHLCNIRDLVMESKVALSTEHLNETFEVLKNIKPSTVHVEGTG